MRARAFPGHSSAQGWCWSQYQNTKRTKEIPLVPLPITHHHEAQRYQAFPGWPPPKNKPQGPWRGTMDASPSRKRERSPGPQPRAHLMRWTRAIIDALEGSRGGHADTGAAVTVSRRRGYRGARPESSKPALVKPASLCASPYSNPPSRQRQRRRGASENYRMAGLGASPIRPI